MFSHREQSHMSADINAANVYYIENGLHYHSVIHWITKGAHTRCLQTKSEVLFINN
jgi:hypothetical protein